MRNILVLVSIFVLALSGGEASRPDKLFKALDTGTIISLEALERGQEPDKFLASGTSHIEGSPAPVVYSPTSVEFLISAASSKPFARAPPAAT